jgi:hypothetical protein
LQFCSRVPRREACGENGGAGQVRRVPPREHALRVELTNGVAIALPVKLIADLKRAARRDVRAVEILGRGGGLHWEAWTSTSAFPVSLSSVFAGPEWLAELGRHGGRRTSAAKGLAARRNGRKGGRPRIRPRAGPVES